MINLILKFKTTIPKITWKLVGWMLGGYLLGQSLDFIDRNAPSDQVTGIFTLFFICAIAIGLFFELFVWLKRKKTGGKYHPWVKFHDSMDQIVGFDCICGKGDNISLGRHSAKKINQALMTMMGVLTFMALFKDPRAGLFFTMVNLLLWGVYLSYYHGIYRKMIKFGHSEQCARLCAKVGIWYQQNHSWFHIYTPRKRKPQGRAQ